MRAIARAREGMQGEERDRLVKGMERRLEKGVGVVLSDSGTEISRQVWGRLVRRPRDTPSLHQV